MSATTIYDVRMRYSLEDRASSGLRPMEQQLQRTARSSGLLSSALGRVGALAAGAFGIHKAQKALIGFNADLEQSRMTMAGMLQLNIGGSFAENMGRATDLVGKLQDRAKASVGTTKDMVEMASMITRPVAQAGLSMAELEDITAGAVVAARAFGLEAGQAALDIEQALAGTLGKKDRFARALLEPLGIDTERFNALNAKARASMLRDALKSDAIRDLAKAQEGSFSGVLSTFQDNLQRFFGSVGLPLFQRITEELKRWNTWIDKNPDKIQAWADRFADGLVRGFEVVKDAMSWVANHKDLLMNLAKAVLVLKGVQGLSGILAGIARGLQQGGGLGGGMAGKLNMVGTIGGAAAAYVQYAFDDATDSMERRASKKADRAFLMDEARRFLGGEGRRLAGFPLLKQEEARAQRLGGFQALQGSRAELLLADALRRGLIDEAGKINKEAINKLTGGWNIANPHEVRRGAEIQLAGEAKMLEDSLRRAFQHGSEFLTQRFLRTAEKAGHQFAAMLGGPAAALALGMDLGIKPPEASDQQKQDKAPKVTINRIEVRSDDPDRFVFQLAETVRDSLKSPSGSAESWREG